MLRDLGPRKAAPSPWAMRSQDPTKDSTAVSKSQLLEYLSGAAREQKNETFLEALWRNETRHGSQINMLLGASRKSDCQDTSGPWSESRDIICFGLRLGGRRYQVVRSILPCPAPQPPASSPQVPHFPTVRQIALAANCGRGPFGPISTKLTG